MKASFSSVASTFLSFTTFIILTITLQSCSNESAFGGMVTQPNLKTNNKTSLAKTTTAPASLIDHSTDTVITLPKSGMTVVISKTLPADKIAQLDKYLQAHKNITTQTQGVIPNALPCNYYLEYDWVLQNYYQSIPGKYLGIWTYKVDWTKCHDQYGFNNIFSHFGDTATATMSHFKKDSIMIGLTYATPIEDILNAQSFNYYLCDEPSEHGVGAEVIFSYASNINYKNPNAKLILTSYTWPEDDICNRFLGNGNIMWRYLTYSNTFITCDQYDDGNPCNRVHEYWDEYKAYYGIPSKNISNWISLTHSDDWGDLLNLASPWGFNPIWIFGDDDPVNESYVAAFSATAWQTGWLTRLEKRLVTRWKCTSSNPCTTCSFPNYGVWVIDDVYYDLTQYVSY